MEVSLLDVEGVPKGCLLSISAGGVRQNMPAEKGLSFCNFPCSMQEAVELWVDVVAPLGHAGLNIEPDIQNGTHHYPVVLEAPAGQNAVSCATDSPMCITLGVRPSIPTIGSRRKRRRKPGGCGTELQLRALRALETAAATTAATSSATAETAATVIPETSGPCAPAVAEACMAEEVQEENVAHGVAVGSPRLHATIKPAALPASNSPVPPSLSNCSRDVNSPAFGATWHTHGSSPITAEPSVANALSEVAAKMSSTAPAAISDVDATRVRTKAMVHKLLGGDELPGEASGVDDVGRHLEMSRAMMRAMLQQMTATGTSVCPSVDDNESCSRAAHENTSPAGACAPVTATVSPASGNLIELRDDRLQIRTCKSPLDCAEKRQDIATARSDKGCVASHATPSTSPSSRLFGRQLPETPSHATLKGTVLDALLSPRRDCTSHAKAPQETYCTHPSPIFRSTSLPALGAFKETGHIDLKEWDAWRRCRGPPLRLLLQRSASRVRVELGSPTRPWKSTGGKDDQHARCCQESCPSHTSRSDLNSDVSSPNQRTRDSVPRLRLDNLTEKIKEEKDRRQLNKLQTQALKRGLKVGPNEGGWTEEMRAQLQMLATLGGKAA